MQPEPIIQKLQQFAESFDNKDWATMKACLANEVYVDYSSFRKTEPATISSSEYVELRKKGLSGLTTNHTYSNYNIIIEGNTAHCECDFMIQRFTGDRSNFFHSYGIYIFELVFKGNNWLISKITQTVDHNEGNPGIHGAFSMN